MLVGVGAFAAAPIARADDTVTYEVFSDFVPVVAGVEYRDTAGKHNIRDVLLPWSLSVPVADALSPDDTGAELRADWRPPFRTAATVGRVLQGQIVTVRISFRGQVLCENSLDVGNAACYGGVPHRSRTGTSYDRSPLFPEPASGLLPGEDPARVD